MYTCYCQSGALINKGLQGKSIYSVFKAISALFQSTGHLVVSSIAGPLKTKQWH